LGWLNDVYGLNPAVKLLIDPSTGRILDANHAAASFYGYSVEQLSSLYIQQINSLSPAEVEAEMARAKEGNRTFFRFGHRLASGELRQVEVYTGPVQVEGKTRLLSIIHDVTVREQALADLAKSERMDAVGRVAGGVAHDFNNLLLVILGAAETLARHPGSREHFVRNVDRIREATQRAAELTKQLLLVSIGHEARGERVDVADVVREIVELASGSLEGAIDVRVQVQQQHVVIIPRSSIDQVLLNLIVNARDAMPAGGILSVAVDDVSVLGPPANPHATLPPGRYVRIQVTDTGVGMEPDVIAKAFEPFFTTKEPGKGTGLGLSTAYGIVRRASGSIEIDSSPGEGATIRVLLPAASDAEAPTAAAPSSRVVPIERASHTILVVEDQRVIRELVEQTLAEAGYRVLSAAGASEAIVIAEQQLASISLLLTDVVMPQMRGPDLAARLRAQRPDLPVVFMSGYTGESLENVGVDAAELLEKPFSADALIARVDQAMKPRKSAPSGDQPRAGKG